MCCVGKVEQKICTLREKNNECKSLLSEFIFVWINLMYSGNVADTQGPCLSNASTEMEWRRLSFSEAKRCDIFLISNDGIYPQQLLLLSTPRFSQLILSLC
jgi:hypothetical protein